MELKCLVQQDNYTNNDIRAQNRGLVHSIALLHLNIFFPMPEWLNYCFVFNGFAESL